MTKYHITPENEPKVCSAKIKCDYATTENPEPVHYSSKQEATVAANKLIEDAAKSSGTYLQSNRKQSLRDDRPVMTVANDPDASHLSLKKLESNSSHIVRGLVGNNKGAPSEILETLSNDDSSYVREMVAGNTSASPELLKKLSEDNSSYVRMNVAYNTSTPVEVLKVLLNDEDESVRLTVEDVTHKETDGCDT